MPNRNKLQEMVFLSTDKDNIRRRNVIERVEENELSANFNLLEWK